MPILIDYKYDPYKTPPHSSYITLIQSYIHPILIKKLEKIGYQDEKLTVSLSPRDPSYYLAHQPIFQAGVYTQVPEDILGTNLVLVGLFDVALIDKSWGIRHNDRVFDPQKYRYDLYSKVDSDSMRVYLEHFKAFPPRHILEKQMKEEEKNFMDALNDFPFSVEIVCDWPDVIFEIYFNDSVSLETIHEIEMLFSKCTAEWNNSKNHKKNANVIHYVGDACLQKRNQMVSIHVDFGDCSPEKVLIFILKYINDSNLNINKIKLT